MTRTEYDTIIEEVKLEVGGYHSEAIYTADEVIIIIANAVEPLIDD